jgi:exopolysaccharide biosynthesis polyprenyl glycosylphosphotransferase
VPPGTPEGSPWTRLGLFGVWPLLVGVDVLAVFIAVTGVAGLGVEVGFDSPTKKTAAFGVILLALFWNAGLYRSRLSLSVLDDFPNLAGRWLAAVALAVLGQILWSKAVWKDYLIDWQFMWGALAIGGFVVLLRSVGYYLVRSMRRSGRVSHPTLILGAGRVGNHVADILRSHRQYGLEPIGFVDDDPSITDENALIPVLGGVKDLTRLLKTYTVRDVVVAFSAVKESEMVGVIRACDRLRCELFVVPRLFELQHVHDEMDNAWGLPLVRLRRATYRSRAWSIKRVVDILVSGTLLVLLLPALLLVALMVRLDGGPGILFRQERVGVDGHTFDVLKFRSLKPADEAESATNWNVSNDARLTSVGRFLRKSSLDELPQLYNILRGDMSLVGPRPERPHFVDQFRAAYPSYEARHRVPCGLTGWAQVHGLRGDTSIADRARFDNYYIENWSLWLDVKIVLRTFASVVRGAGS